MKALCWCGKNKVQVEDVAQPRILDQRDIIVRTTFTTICGSDLHLLDGYVPSLRPGDILGHEIVGEVVETGTDVKKLRVGQHVVVSSVIACGHCGYCKSGRFSLCDNSNPHAAFQQKVHGCVTAGVFGFSALYGGYAGCQAEYVRVPFADVGAFALPEGMSDEQGLACSDIFPTGYMAADNCGIRGGEIVAVWGCGSVGLFAIKSAYLLGAEQVIAIDNLPERLHLAADCCGATTINHDRENVPDALMSLTGGRGPDACIDAVGMEAHGVNLFDGAMEQAKVKLMLQAERLSVVRQAIQCCGKGGTVSLIGAYGGMADALPLGLAFNKGLQFRMGNMHGPKYIPILLDNFARGGCDPAFVYTHRLPLKLAAEAYQMFKRKEDRCVKVLLAA